jgi:hypothetical protein
MRLSEREVNYLTELADAFGHRYFSKAMREVLRMRAKGMTHLEVESKRGFKGSKQLQSMALKHIRRVVCKSQTPITPSDCIALLIKPKL